jgi:hypothetical protein
MASCNVLIEMQLFQSNAHGDGKNIDGNMKRKKEVCSIMRWCGQHFEKS